MDANMIKQLEMAKTATAGLQKENFKVKVLFDMMNNCADKCSMVYQESGIEDESKPGVSCYKNCLSKSYKLATQSL